MRYLLIAGLLFLAGCATEENYKAVLDSWLGSDADRLVLSWGPPNRQHTFADGRRMLTYDKSRTAQIGGHSYTEPVYNYATGTTVYVERTRPSQDIQFSCSTSFIVDRSNKIVDWRYQGNDCKAFASD